MKPEERNYIADVERYFLKLAGKGIMLSARDYGFIRELAQRSVSREAVIKAIACGFQERERRGTGKPRDLFDIKEEIEQYLKTCIMESKREPDDSVGGTFDEKMMMEGVIKKLDRVIMEESGEYLREKYRNLRKLVLSEGGRSPSNMYRRLDSLWRDFLEDVFSDLPQEKQRLVDAAAEAKLPAEAKFYDESAREKTLLAFREKILLETLGVKNVFTMK